MIGLGIGLPFRRGGGAGFSPAELFAGGEAGAWYDPTDAASMYANVLGSTAATVGQPIALIFDKRLDLDRGAEKLADPSFDTGTGWTLGAGWTVSGGSANRANTGSFSNLQQISLALGVNSVFEVTVTVTVTSGAIDLRVGDVTAGGLVQQITVSGTYTYRIKPRGAGNGFTLVANTTFAGSVAYASVREILGNHATSATPANQTLILSGSKTYIDHDAGDLAVALPSLGTDATLAYCSESGVTVLEGQTITGSTTLPIKSILGPIVFLDRRLTSVEYADLYQYLLANSPASTLVRYAASDGTLPTLVADFSRSFFYWNGSVRAIGDLTVESGLGYSLASAAWLNQAAFTSLVEWEVPATGALSAEETLFSLANTGSAERFAVTVRSSNKGQIIFDVDTPLASLASVEDTAPFPNHPYLGRSRYMVRCNATATYKVIRDGHTKDNTASGSVYDALGANLIAFGYRQIAGGSKTQPFSNVGSLTVVSYNTAFSDAVMEATAKKSFDGLPAIYLLCDSISNERLYPDGGGLWSRLRHSARGFGYNAFASSIVGGTSLVDFATRFSSDTEHEQDNVVIYEGGLDFELIDELSGLVSILAQNKSKRFVLIEPIKDTTLTAGSAKRIDHDAAWAALVSTAGAANVIYTHEALKARNDGSANDLADVANDICPRSLRQDGIHPNAAGQDALNAIILPELVRRKWFF